MNNLSEKILSSREYKFNKIQFLKTSYKVVITVKSNIPGNNKNLNVSYILVEFFEKLIPLNMIEYSCFHDGYDGPYFLLGSNLDPVAIKQILMDIEETHPLGRFIDLDVYDGNQTLSRGTMRKCYLCDDFAFKCIKMNKHKKKDLLNFVNSNVLNFFKKQVLSQVNESIMFELNLHPKFGLVTPLTNGSHKDMNFNLMIKAKESILPFFIKMFEVGWSDKKLEDIFLAIRQIGLQAEKEMLAATNNVNTYKGLIFDLGIVVTAYGYTLYNHIDRGNIFDIIKKMTLSLLEEFKVESNTFGYTAYKNHNILGARGEIFNGLPNVKRALDYLDDFTDESRLKTLMYLISKVDDTTLLKRTKDYEMYISIKQRFSKKLKCNQEEIEMLNSYCISNNLSFGGSADLLILTIFLKKIFM